jgi:predicted metalloprotease
MTMRFGGRRTSDNVESQRGMSFGGGGGGLGGGAGMLLGLVASRFGIGGVIVLVIIMAAFGGLGGLTGGGGGGEQQGVAPGQQVTQQSAAQVCSEDSTTRFSCQVLASTEEHWTRLFAAEGRTYQAPRMRVYSNRGNSGCGAAQSAMGPFYCPTDQRIYLDTSFFEELARQYQAPGDFAQAYVIAHEVGHHIQALTGTLDRASRVQSGAREAQANAVQVQVELQADCYAGVWAAQERGAMEPGDIEEGMTAAAAIGDDTLQRAGQGRVVPESFTHGTAAQRQEALMRGYRGGNAGACASYTQGV